MLGLHDHLQFGGAPHFVDHLNRLVVADLPGRNGHSGAGAIRGDAVDYLRSQLLHVRRGTCATRRTEIERVSATRCDAGKAPHEYRLPVRGRQRRQVRSLHGGKFHCGLGVRVERIIHSRHGVGDENGLGRSALSGESADIGKRLLAALPPLAVAIHRRRRVVHDTVAIGQRLRGLRHRLRRVGRALDGTAPDHLARHDAEGADHAWASAGRAHRASADDGHVRLGRQRGRGGQ